MSRFFVDPAQIGTRQITISGNDVNHIKNVLRMEKGADISISDGQGRDYFCVISQIDKDRIVLDIQNSWDSYVELGTKIYLFQGLPKSDKMELIIQKAVELGVYEIIPVVTRRTIVKLDEKKEVKKLARWQGISESAAKQAGRGIIPSVRPPVSFKDALEFAGTLDSVIIPYEKAEGMEASRAAVKGLKNKKSVGIFIGPEGGFDTEEVDAAMESGAVPVTLGRRILRTETAGLAVLSVLMFELED